MSEVIDAAIAALNDKIGDAFDGTAKFVIEGEGAVLIGPGGAREGDDDAEVTLTASAENFQAMMKGELNPTTAFMTGKLKVDGDMGAAMRLGSALT